MQRAPVTLPWRGRVGEWRSHEPGWGEWESDVSSPHPAASLTLGVDPPLQGRVKRASGDTDPRNAPQ